MPNGSELPPDVANSVDLLADSLEALHVLLLLQRWPDRAWTATEVAVDLGISVPSAQRELAALRSRGLAIVDPADGAAFRFDVSNDETLAEHVRRIADAYGTRRIALINHVATGALQRIRALADAFRVTKTDKP